MKSESKVLVHLERNATAEARAFAVAAAEDSRLIKERGGLVLFDEPARGSVPLPFFW